ncbi:hypothetical protein P5673_015847 [Acropora cervicornis]|uniref:Uncharacterized protein n=1 Tax=Acropora cervicornis TaxID=6130 RepID=A0AAD9V4V7_ACRCE|nr:hypothetical protein P5673_015847 [Acropora cervicornis]
MIYGNVIVFGKKSLSVDVTKYVTDREKLTNEEKCAVLQLEKHRYVSVNFQYPKTSGRRFNSH